MKINAYKILKPVNVSAEQTNIIKHNLFIGDCDKFFKQIGKNSLNSNIYMFGKLTNEYIDSGIDDFKVKTICKSIRNLISKDASAKNINLVNVIYSTLIKNITPENIISGEVKPETYKKIIEESINMYKSYPLNKGIDYRHILGRMVSLMNMSVAVYKKLNKFPQTLKSIEWTDNEQLELVNVLERIVLQYKSANTSFVEKINKYTKRKATTQEKVRHKYFNNIMKLLWMLLESSLSMMKKENPNPAEIMYNMDVASFYSAKIPYDDVVRMPKIWEIHEEFKKINNELQKILKKKNKKG